MQQKKECSCFERLEEHLDEPGHGGLISRQQINMEYAVHLCMRSNDHQRVFDCASLDNIGWLLFAPSDPMGTLTRIAPARSGQGQGKG